MREGLDMKVYATVHQSRELNGESLETWAAE